MAQQQPLKPQLFVFRQNGAMVPLIAMDELPIHVQVRNVPRSLSQSDVAGMTNVGVFEARHQYYIVEGLPNAKPIYPHGIHAPPAYNERVSGVGTSKPLSAAAVAATSQSPKLTAPAPAPAPAPASSKASSIQDTPGINTSSNASPSGVSMNSEGNRSKIDSDIVVVNNTAVPTLKNNANPQAQVPDARPKPRPGAKEYCSFWLRRGECDYAQQGCIYKHEMPEDLETLERLGLLDLPRWYREKYGKGSLLVNGGKNTPSYGIADANLGPPRMRVGDDAKRMLARHLGGFGGHGRGTGGRQRGKTSTPALPGKSTAPVPPQPAEKEKADHREELINLDDDDDDDHDDHHHHHQNELARKLLADKHQAKMPVYRNHFEGDLASSTFSNGEEDPETASLKQREQAGWEEEQAARAKTHARAQAKADVAVKGKAPAEKGGKEEKKQAESGPSSTARKRRGRRGGRRRGGGGDAKPKKE